MTFRLFGLAVLALVAACAEKEPSAQGFRTPGTGIYSNAVLQNERLVGEWLQVADFVAPEAPECRSGALGVRSASASQLTIDGTLCLGGTKTGFGGEAIASGPGRFLVTGAEPGGPHSEWWVLWVDEGYRTMVVGTPSGSFGMILNRDAVLPADRLQAARDVLRWNGYDLARLRLIARG